MSAKWMNPRKRASSLSNRVKTRRKAFKRRNNRSTSLRLAVQLPVVRPGGNSVPLRWDHGRESQLQRQLAGFISLVGPVHE